MKYYAYEIFKNDTNKLITQVHSFAPTAILAIARGGFTLGHAMAEGLGIRDLQSLRTELYDKSEKRDVITLFGSCDYKEGTKVLVVDDISDSGETLSFVMHYLKENFPQVTFKSATLFYKPTSCYEPDFWIDNNDEWIDFFWEKDFK
ncbi:MAG: phosphoribosyltransferase family protein [Sulfurimonadaceae bacterium]|jgi:xanthine phosphoribosyltransferase|nr:phosphoribosyltransferase family protein [Sulfurimonadaceae bacterium]